MCTGVPARSCAGPAEGLPRPRGSGVRDPLHTSQTPYEAKLRGHATACHRLGPTTARSLGSSQRAGRAPAAHPQRTRVLAGVHCSGCAHLCTVFPVTHKSWGAPQQRGSAHRQHPPRPVPTTFSQPAGARVACVSRTAANSLAPPTPPALVRATTTSCTGMGQLHWHGPNTTRRATGDRAHSDVCRRAYRL